MTHTSTLIKKHSTMAESVKDLIKITRKKRNQRRKSKNTNSTEEAEVMTSDDDDNPEGAQSSDDKKYRIYIDPDLFEEMRKHRARMMRVVQGEDGVIEIIYQ